MQLQIKSNQISLFNEYELIHSVTDHHLKLKFILRHIVLLSKQHYCLRIELSHKLTDSMMGLMSNPLVGLVGDDEGVVLYGESGNELELLDGVDLAQWVQWVVQQDSLGLVVEETLHLLAIDDPIVGSDSATLFRLE